MIMASSKKIHKISALKSKIKLFSYLKKLYGISISSHFTNTRTSNSAHLYTCIQLKKSRYIPTDSILTIRRDASYTEASNAFMNFGIESFILFVDDCFFYYIFVFRTPPVSAFSGSSKSVLCLSCVGVVSVDFADLDAFCICACAASLLSFFAPSPP